MPLRSENIPLDKPVCLRFRYIAPVREHNPIAFSFLHPVPQDAVGEIVAMEDTPSAPSVGFDRGVEVLFVPSAFKNDAHWKDFARVWLEADPSADEAVTVSAGDIRAQWKAARIAVTAPPREAQAAIRGVVDFAFHEAALRKIENAISGNWGIVEKDAPLAYVTTTDDLKQDKQIGERMQAVIGLHLQLSRLQPRLMRPDPHLSPLAKELGEALREAVLCEERAETVGGQIETQEYIYELTSQRIGEHRHARQGFVIEVVIVILLAAEVISTIGGILPRLD